MLASPLQQRLLKSAAALFPGFGIGLLALAAFFAVRSWLPTRSLIRSEATVTENVATQDAKGTVLYTAHLRFRDSTGATVALIDPVQSQDSDNPDLATGAVVPVLYPPGHPGSARIATVWRVYRTAIFCAIFGVAFIDIGVIARLRLKRYAQKSLDTGGTISSVGKTKLVPDLTVQAVEKIGFTDMQKSRPKPL